MPFTLIDIINFVYEGRLSITARACMTSQYGTASEVIKNKVELLRVSYKLKGVSKLVCC